MKRFLVQNTLVLLFILFSTIFLYGEDSVRVLSVSDGDTLKVNYNGKEERLRLIGIDAPESRPNERAKIESARSREDLKTITAMGKAATT
jgi:micrococcal nuclease